MHLAFVVTYLALAFVVNKYIQYIFFFENDRSFHLIMPLILNWDCVDCGIVPCKTALNLQFGP